MKKIIFKLLWIMFFPIPHLLFSQSLLDVQELVGCDTVSYVKVCGTPKSPYVVFISKLSDLKFKNEKLLFDTLKDKYNGKYRYFICLEECNGGNLTFTISENECEINHLCYFGQWYEIKKKLDIPELIKKTSSIAIQVGQGNTYSPMSNVGLGVAVLWRFGNRVGWGIQGGLGWYSIKEREHTGVEIIDGNYTKKLTTNFIHVSCGLKCYPLFKSKYSLVKGMNVLANWGTMGAKEYSAYNNLDGSFSLGGIKIMHGFSIMAGEDFFFNIGKKNLVVSGGIGGARSLNLSKEKNVWKIAVDVGIGLCWKIKRG